MGSVFIAAYPRLFYAGTVFIVFGAGFAASRLARSAGLAAVTSYGLIIASTGCLLMAMLALVGFRNFASYLLPIIVFLFGMGLVNPLGTALTLVALWRSWRFRVGSARLYANGRGSHRDRRDDQSAVLVLSRAVDCTCNANDSRIHAAFSYAHECAISRWRAGHVPR